MSLRRAQMVQIMVRIHDSLAWDNPIHLPLFVERRRPRRIGGWFRNNPKVSPTTVWSRMVSG